MPGAGYGNISDYGSWFLVREAAKAIQRSISLSEKANEERRLSAKLDTGPEGGRLSVWRNSKSTSPTPTRSMANEKRCCTLDVREE